MAFLSRGPLAFPLSPSWASPAARVSRTRPASRQATAAPPFRAQPLTAWPRCQSCPLPPASTPGQPQPPPNCARSSRIVGASPAPRPRFIGARPPARTRLLPAPVFALAKHRGSPQPPQPKVAGIRHRRARNLRASSRLRAAPVSISPLVSFALFPYLSRYRYFLFFLAS